MSLPHISGRISLVVFLLIAAAACSWVDPDARETTGEKNEWSVLQGVEVTNRNIRISEPAFQVVNEYELMSVPGLNGENIWIMLKPTSPPFYKQMPQGNYVLPKDVVETLVREHRVSYTVEQVLKSHLAAK